LGTKTTINVLLSGKGNLGGGKEQREREREHAELSIKLQFEAKNTADKVVPLSEDDYVILFTTCTVAPHHVHSHTTY
jgi:hypothetical protein